MDWNNPKNDRARAAYDNFDDLDGQFDNNVVIQIKNGPIDFQVREPASPLFAALPKTNQAIELQITQEYMGQARHMVFLVPHVEGELDSTCGRRRRQSAGLRQIHRSTEVSWGSRTWGWTKLVGQSPFAGQPLWLRAPGLEP